jgi:putative ATP-dependent endonuclease of OLD family
MATGAKNGEVAYAAPYQHQGTGTINMLVLALLSMIADAKKTVIFAMEEPETAIPPSSQKSIVSGVRSKSSQAIFTSHSPYVLEEFNPQEIMVLSRDCSGSLAVKPLKFPEHIKPKLYGSEFRLRFAEALLSRRVLIAEGQTEASAYPAAARRLAELDPKTYSSLEALCITVFNAKTDSQIAGFGTFFRDLGKTLFAVYDKQEDAAQKAQIESSVDYPFESATTDFEETILNETAESALRRFALKVVDSAEWPSHLHGCKPNAQTTLPDLRLALRQYLNWGKGNGTAGDLLAECSIAEMPMSIKSILTKMKEIVCPLPTAPGTSAATGSS